MVLVHKRLEDGKFVWSRMQDGVMRPLVAASSDCRVVDLLRAAGGLVLGAGLAVRSAGARAAPAGSRLIAGSFGKLLFCWPEWTFHGSLWVIDAAALARENALLKARLAEVEEALAESQEANRRLEDFLRTSQRAQFGKRSEKQSPDQFNLSVEDAELARGVLASAQEKAEVAL
jgi:hypothetical protein